MSTRPWRMTLAWTVHALAGVFMMAPRLAAQCDETILTPIRSMSQDAFGSSIHVNGDALAIGAPIHSLAASANGAAFVFRRNGAGWTEEAALTSPTPLDNQAFGRVVRIDGDTLMASAVRQPVDLPGGSAVFAFEKVGGAWIQTQRLVDPVDTGAHVDHFGIDIWLRADRAYIGNAFRGVLHIYDRAGGLWQETGFLTEADVGGFANATFSEVEVEGDLMVVSHAAGAPVHVLEFDGTDWNLAATLNSSPPGQFATNAPIAIDGRTVLVGSEFEISASGVVHVFEEVGGTWQRVQVIRAADPMTGAGFGISVAVEDGRLVVGAEGDDGIAINAGAIYLFEKQGGIWQQVLKATSAQAAQSALMGKTVAIQGPELFAGSPPNGFVGRTHVFTVASPIGSAFGEALANSTGAPASLLATGSIAIDHDCLTLAAASLPPAQFGYFLMARAQGFVPLFGGSQGNLHLALPIVRFSGDVLLVDALGEAVFSPDLHALPQATVFQPGDTWNFQMWFRDVNPGPTSNTTNGLALTFATTGDPAVQFPVTLSSQVEEALQLSVTVTLSQPSGQDVLVPYTTGGSATYGVDWRVEEPNPIVIPAGASAYEMTVIVAQDAAQEGDETCTITLGAPTGGVLGTAPSFTLTVVDDD